MNRTLSLAALATLATFGLTFGACKKTTDDSGITTDGGGTDGGGTDGGTDGGGTDGGGTDGGGTATIDFTLSGSTVDLMSHSAVAAGTCIDAVNPDPAVTGGDPIIMASAKIGSDGSFSIAGVDAKPAFGILLSIKDCTGGTAVLTTATPVLPTLYTAVDVGGEVSGLTAFSVNAAYADGINASLAAAGYTGDIWKDGGLMGGVWDAALAPIEGATVTGASGTVYYQDGDMADGLYTTTGVLNASTVAAGGAIFLLPMAPIGSYSATASGHTFGTNTLGSSAGSIVFAPLIAGE